MDIIDKYYEKAPTKMLRKIAKENKEQGGIFKNYNETEINILTKRQLTTIFKIEKKYLELRRDI